MPRKISKLAAGLVMAAGIAVIGGSIAGGIALAADHGDTPAASVNDTTGPAAPAADVATTPTGAGPDRDSDSGTDPDEREPAPASTGEDAEKDDCDDDCADTPDDKADDEDDDEPDRGADD